VLRCGDGEPLVRPPAPGPEDPAPATAAGCERVLEREEGARGGASAAQGAGHSFTSCFTLVAGAEADADADAEVAAEVAAEVVAEGAAEGAADSEAASSFECRIREAPLGCPGWGWAALGSPGRAGGGWL